MATNLTSVNFKIPAHSDAVMISRFEAFAKRVEANDLTFNFLIGGEPAVVKPGAVSENETLKRLIELDSHTIKEIHVKKGSQFTATSHYVESDPLFRKISIGAGQSQDQAHYIEWVGAAKKELGEVAIESTLKEYLDQNSQNFLKTRDLFLDRQEKIASETINRVNNYLVELTDRFTLKQAELEAAFQKREAEQSALFGKRSAALDDREAQLTKKLAEVNDRESKFERRQTVKDLIRQLDSSTDDFKFQLTQSTRRMRTPVAVASAIFLFCLAGAAGFFAYWDILPRLSGTPSEAADTWLWVRPTLLMASFFAAFAFFIRWLNSWAHQHAKEEFRLKRTLLDVRRANLLLEAALEWHTEAKGEMPDALVETLGRDLFRGGTTSHEEVAPVDSLASALLGSAANARLKIGENELVIDRKGLRRLAKAESNGQKEI